LTTALRLRRSTRAKKLLQRHAGGIRKILFIDEKVLTVVEKFYRQNDRVYAHNSQEGTEIITKVERGHHPASVMVWWGISYERVTNLHFCAQGVKTRATNNQSDILEKVVKPLSNTVFAQFDKTLHQRTKRYKSSAVHWLDVNFTEFIASVVWPPAIPDLNPLEYSLRNILEKKASSKPL
jgi:hypothetical protein